LPGENDHSPIARAKVMMIGDCLSPSDPGSSWQLLSRCA
jgi:hypothetical protein